MVNRNIRKNLQIRIISILINKILQIKIHLFQNLSKPNFPIDQTYSQNEIKKTEINNSNISANENLFSKNNEFIESIVKKL